MHYYLLNYTTLYEIILIKSSTFNTCVNLMGVFVIIAAKNVWFCRNFPQNLLNMGQLVEEDRMQANFWMNGIFFQYDKYCIYCISCFTHVCLSLVWFQEMLALQTIARMHLPALRMTCLLLSDPHLLKPLCNWPPLFFGGYSHVLFQWSHGVSTPLILETVETFHLAEL